MYSTAEKVFRLRIRENLYPGCFKFGEVHLGPSERLKGNNWGRLQTISVVNHPDGPCFRRQ